MFCNEDFDHVLNSICHQATACLLLLNCWISSFRARGKDFKGCRPRLMQGNATIGSDRKFAKTSSGPPIEHDENFASFGGNLYPNPGQPLSQYTMSCEGLESASIALLVSFTLGIGNHPRLLPDPAIGSPAGESVSIRVIVCLIQLKEVQGLIHLHQGMSTLRKTMSENQRGEGWDEGVQSIGSISPSPGCSA